MDVFSVTCGRKSRKNVISISHREKTYQFPKNINLLNTSPRLKLR